MQCSRTHRIPKLSRFLCQKYLTWWVKKLKKEDSEHSCHYSYSVWTHFTQNNPFLEYTFVKITFLNLSEFTCRDIQRTGCASYKQLWLLYWHFCFMNLKKKRQTSHLIYFNALKQSESITFFFFLWKGRSSSTISFRLWHGVRSRVLFAKKPCQSPCCNLGTSSLPSQSPPYPCIVHYPQRRAPWGQVLCLSALNSMEFLSAQLCPAFCRHRELNK